MRHPNAASFGLGFAPYCATVAGLPEALRLEIAAARRRRGWSQITLAEHAGTVRSTISRLERGETMPRVDTLEAILQHLHLPLEMAVSIRSESVPSPDRPTGEDAQMGGDMRPDSAIARLLHFCLSLTEAEASAALSMLRQLISERGGSEDARH